MKMTLTLLSLALAALVSTAQAAEAVSSSDKEFAVKAAQDGMAEVEMGELAQKRASSDSVKKYAGQLVEAHTTANEELKTIAQAQGITLPKSLSKEDQKLQDELASLSGAEFDQRFVQAQIKDHQEAIDLFQAQTEEGQSQELKSYAENTLPHLESHLRAAEKLAAETASSSR